MPEGKRYQIVCEIEVCATSPEIAAMVARDIMLDLAAPIQMDVLPIEWYEPADDFLPNEDHGWSVWFGRPERIRNEKSKTNDMWPNECIPWEKVKP